MRTDAPGREYDVNRPDKRSGASRFHTRGARVPRHGVSWLAIGLVALAACADDEPVDVSPLVDDAGAAIAVYVVQVLDPDTTLGEGGPVDIHNQTGERVVAIADAAPRVVPVAYGEPTADPNSDFMQVVVQVEPEFIDDISQVELSIDLGADGEDDWCRPMEPDPVVPGSYYLKLQPACTEADRDPLTGTCVVMSVCEAYPYGCRQDLLTFTLWNDISSLCHGETST